MIKPRNPSGTRRAHTRRTKTGKRVRIGQSSIKNRQNRKHRGRSRSTGTSRKAMSNGQWRRRRKKQVWSRVAWSTTGTASFVFFQQQRYASAAIFGLFAVGFGMIDLGMTINRKRKERSARKAKLEKQRNRSTSRNRATSSRPSVKMKVRNRLETGVVAAAARKPTLDTEYRDAERERREGKERIPVG